MGKLEGKIALVTGGAFVDLGFGRIVAGGVRSREVACDRDDRLAGIERKTFGPL